jgi:hypothetical protein
MEKKKKDLKKYVLVVGGSRGEIEDVLELFESGLSIEGYLRIIGEREIESLMESCVSEEEEEDMRNWIKDFRVGVIEKYDSKKGFEVYGVCLGEESSMLVFEGKEEDIEEVESWDEVYDCLGIFC